MELLCYNGLNLQRFVWEKIVIDIIAEIWIELRSEMTIEKTTRHWGKSFFSNGGVSRHLRMLEDESHVSRSTYIFGCYVIVDVGRKYVVFQALNFAIKIKKNNSTS